MDIRDFFAQKSFSFGKRVEFMPRTRTRYVENSSQSYGVGFDPQKILFILDDTMMGSGRDGCVIAVTGIAFKEMFQKPVYIPFDQIKRVQVTGRAVLVNASTHTQEFHLVDQADVHTVFAAVQEWISYRDSQTVDYADYAQKMVYVKAAFKGTVMPLIKEELRKRLDDEEGTAEVVEEIHACIDDIERLEGLIGKKALALTDTNYIDGLVAVLSAFGAFTDDKQLRFDHKLLEIKNHDQGLGQFTKNVLKVVVLAIQESMMEDKRMDRLKDYL